MCFDWITWRAEYPKVKILLESKSETMFTRQININTRFNTDYQPPGLQKVQKTNPKASKYGLLTQTPLVCVSAASLRFCLRRSLFKSSLKASNQMHNITPSPSSFNPNCSPSPSSDSDSRGDFVWKSLHMHIEEGDEWQPSVTGVEKSELMKGGRGSKYSTVQLISTTTLTLTLKPQCTSHSPHSSPRRYARRLSWCPSSYMY